MERYLEEKLQRRIARDKKMRDVAKKFIGKRSCENENLRGGNGRGNCYGPPRCKMKWAPRESWSALYSQSALRTDCIDTFKVVEEGSPMLNKDPADEEEGNGEYQWIEGEYPEKE